MDPKWSQIMFFNIPNYISSAAVGTVSVHKDYVRVTSLTTDTTSLNYNTKFHDRTSNNSSNSLLNEQETFNGNRNLTQRDIQTSSHFVNKEIVETIPTTA